MSLETTFRETLKESSHYAMGLSDPNSGPPTGSSGALAGAMGAALIAGVCTASLDTCRSEKAEEELLRVRDRSLSLRRDLLASVEHGAQAAEEVAAARESKRMDDQERFRAILFAAEVPLRTAESCHALLDLSLRALGRTGIKAIPELGTATALAHAGVVGGVVTARTFLAAIPAGSGVGAEAARKRSERILRDAEALRTQLIDRVRQHLP